MSKKLVVRIVIVFIIVFIISALGFYIFSIISDVNTTKKNGEDIISSFDSFRESVILFSDEREELTLRMSDDLYLDTVKEVYSEYVVLLDNYQSLITNIESNSSLLINNCSASYSDVNVEQKCDAFDTMYEEVINLFVYDVNRFNEIVVSSGSDLNIYESNHKEFIDYNGDGNYLGMEG